MKNEGRLIALPVIPPPPSKRRISVLARRRVVTPVDERPEDWYRQTQRRAVKDMKTLVGHIRRLLDHPAAEKAGGISLIEDIDGSLDDIAESIDRFEFDPQNHPSADNLSLSSLEIALDAGSAWSGDLAWPETPEMELLARLIRYWLGEIRYRGFELRSLLIQEIVAIEMRDSFAALDDVRFARRAVPADFEK